MIGPNSNETLQEIADLLLKEDDFAICGHSGPDGDCLGATLALFLQLKSMGKRVVPLYSKGVITPNLQCIPGVEYLVEASACDHQPRCFIVVDASDTSRLSDDAATLCKNAEITFVLDHHISDICELQHRYADPDAPAASLIIWNMITEAGWTPASQVAQSCYCGLISDTGGFRFQNSTAESFKAAYEMVASGVDAAYYADKMFMSRTPASMKLQQIALDRMELLDCGLAMTYLKLEDFPVCGAIKEDADCIIDVMRSVIGVRVACILREQPNDVRGSLRARDNTDVALIASRHNGGGHKEASGLTMYEPISEAYRILREDIVGVLTE